MKKLNNIFIAFFIVLLMGGCGTKKAEWTYLFNGQNLDGWTQKNGEAPYEVVDSTIVGTSVLNTANSFLCTEKIYSDFILELEFKVDENLNSGVQIRSNSVPEYRDGRVHGYQVEIDPSPRAYSGGIYDEARRGWLYAPVENTEAQNAFKHNEWNKYHIEAIGDTIKTWLNDVQVSYLVDNVTDTGFIALQVHSIGQDSSKLGAQVQWKNIRIVTENFDQFKKQEKMTVRQVNLIPNTLTDWEKEHGFKLLFDGKTTEGWRGAHKEEFPESGWKVEDGILTVLESGGAESQNGGDIVTVDEYKDFEFMLEFRLTEGANSGIKYYITEGYDPNGSAIGLEYQLLDDKNHPDAKLGNHEGSRTLASLYDLIKAENKRFTGIGEWNHARIVSKGNHVEHWLNGLKVLEYERNTDAFQKLVDESKYKDYENFGKWEKGHILLQDHGNRVSFRSIKVREL